MRSRLERLARAVALRFPFPALLSPLAWRYRFASHARWMRDVHPGRAARFELAGVSLESCPGLSLVTPVYDGSPPGFLVELLGSVLAQEHERFEWILVDDGTTAPANLRAFEVVKERCPRARFVTLPARQGIVAATFAGARAAKNPWLVFADADDVLAPDALSSVARVAGGRPDVELVYSDSDHMDARGRRYAPAAKPPPSPELALGEAYSCHLHAMTRAFFLANAEERAELEGALDWSLLIRALERPERVEHIPRVLYSWRIHDAGHSAAGREPAPFDRPRIPSPGAREAAAKLARAQTAVLEGYLERRGLRGRYRVEPRGGPGRFRLRPVGEREPGVTVVVRAGGDRRRLESSLASLRANTLSGHDEVLVLESGPGALPAVETPYVAFVSDGLEGLASDWLREAVGALEREPGIALVGGRIEGEPDRPARGALRREVLAVAGAPWVARTAAVEAAAGLAGVASTDASELCRRLRAAGLRIVHDPEMLAPAGRARRPSA